MIAPILRGTVLGSALGILPGGGALLASFGAYTLEKKVSKILARVRQGRDRGRRRAESANNAGAQTSFIPLLTLGIPSNAVMALMIGAMMIQGIAPGPQVMTERPQLFWGMIASMWVGNLMLVILNLPLIGMWIKLLTVPYRYLYPSILLFMAIGVFSISNQPFDCFLMACFGLLGYVCVKLGCEPAPLILGFILGPLMEENLRRAMLLSRGDPWVFISPSKPISMGFLHRRGAAAGDHRAAGAAQEARRSLRRGKVGITPLHRLLVLLSFAGRPRSRQPAQAWPSRPLRLVAPVRRGRADRYLGAPAGRQAAGVPRAARGGGEPPGAGGNIGVDLIAKGPADGYNLVMSAIATLAINPSLYPSLPYDPLKDLRHVTLLVQVPNVLIVANDLPAKSVKELIALARSARPGKLDFGSGSTGSTGHLAGEMFKMVTGTFMVHIPYKGVGARAWRT